MNDGYRISNIGYWILDIELILDIGYCILDCHMTFDFSGQVVLVTGASRGIGEQMAHDFAECGAQLIVTSTSSDDREELVERIDVCVNNAGTTRHGSLDAASSDDWDVTYITGQSLLVDGGYSIV